MKSGWQLKPLSDLCGFQRGLTYAKSDEVSESRNVVLRANNVDLESNNLLLEDLRYIADSVVIPSDKRVKKGSMLICTASGSKSHLGKVAYVDRDMDYAFGGFMGQITPNDEIDGRYLFYALTAPAYKEFIAALSDGANINNLKFNDLGNYLVGVPDLDEQQRIVAILDEAFAEIATAKANAEKNLQNARALFESYLNKVFTERGEGWAVTTLDKISTNLDSRRVPITKSDRKPGEYPYYGASGVVDYVEDYIFEDNALLISEDGANLLARSTPIAFSVTGKYWVNNHAHILKFDDMATQRFVEFYLASVSLDGYITGAAQPKLNQKALNSIPIPLPVSLDAQRRIVERIEVLEEDTQRLESIYQQKLAALDELKQSLLSQAFSGAL